MMDYIVSYTYLQIVGLQQNFDTNRVNNEALSRDFRIQGNIVRPQTGPSQDIRRSWRRRNYL